MVKAGSRYFAAILPYRWMQLRFAWNGKKQVMEDDVNTKERMIKAIAELEGEVVLRSDLAGFGSERAVSKLIRQLIADGAITRISLGVYAKTRPSRFSDGPVLRMDFVSVGWEACQRLGIEVKLGRAAQAYNNRETTQVPVRVVFNTGKRIVRRIISRGLQRIYFENDVNREIYPDPWGKK